MERLFPDMANTADAGLLIIHGVGDHGRTTVLKEVLDPTLNRLSTEGQLANVAYDRIGEPDDADGLDCMGIDYSLDRIHNPTSPANTRHLFVVEGNWAGAFSKASSERMSSWVGRNSLGMVVQSWIYFARGLLLALPALASFGLLLCALLSPFIIDDGRDILGLHLEQEPFAIVAVVSALLLALVTASLADLALLRTSLLGRRWWVFFAAASTLLAYQMQRGLVLTAGLFAAMLLPIGTALLRLLSSVPFLSGLANSLLPKLETALFTGGMADMEAVANNQVTAAVIRAQVARGLAEVEYRVKPGGTLTVLAHSGGGPVAWRLLSEPNIHARQATKQFRYRLITVGSALNWAKRGFGCIATPLDGKLVNHGQDKPEQRTFWLNCYGMWDTVPHGPVNPTDFDGYAVWPDPVPNDRELPPNQGTRNVGAPVPNEHNEYWRNQQEFVPALLRAIDPDIAWASRDAGVDQPLWTNCRLALLSGLVRTRLALIALPLAAFGALVRHERFLSCNENHGVLAAPYTNFIAKGLKAAIDASTLSDSTKAKLGLCDHPFLADLISVVVVTLLVYALLDVYTNFLWQSLGRRTQTMRPTASPPPRIAFPLLPAVLVWLPTLVILPAVIYPFGLGTTFFRLILAVNTAITFLEVLWLNTCLRAFQDSALRAVCAVPIGRHRRAAFRSTPAGLGRS